ncbi:PhoH family protein [Thermoactinomyces sp. DSM 45892]|uniref:PhoH family protein n=1 Tax=Thermoactinomyces sp. DSM 45892 TaxID=1882753 RepID=UPI0008978F32|nr:PhoH family protein [Thermoactinomyces sp. DSM 45892]SDZ18570.1 Predicted ribonuclease YlaK, contains NYN-type RNase and PhoH-family ATPase domains [Thermoactinomyces sp. DSM 45892]
MKYVIDTNVLLTGISCPEELQDAKFVITAMVLRELEKHKLSHNPRLAYDARVATRYIEQNQEQMIFDTKDYTVQLGDQFDPNYADNKILQCCVDNQYGIITNDLLLKQKARGLGIQVLEQDQDECTYTGYIEADVDDERYASLLHNLDENVFELLPNQYLVINNGNKHVDLLRWTGETHMHVRPRGFETLYFGKFSPRDAYQRCALDSLRNNPMTVVKGKAGTGKSLIALNYAMHQIEKGKYDRLICFVNPMAARNSAKLGFYPGTRDEKIMDSAIGSMLCSKFGDKMVLEELMKGNEKEKQPPKLLLLPFSDIRGFDTTGMKAIVYIIEAQNLDVDLMKLAVQRVGEDSKLIIDGDFEAQVDHTSYEGINNGMRRLSEVFRGQPYYGEVELPFIYRSEIARKADEM